jgi:predicted GIY-YIG superfamily endonuclease
MKREKEIKKLNHQQKLNLINSRNTQDNQYGN